MQKLPNSLRIELQLYSLANYELSITMGVTFDKLLRKPLLHKHQPSDIEGLGTVVLPDLSNITNVQLGDDLVFPDTNPSSANYIRIDDQAATNVSGGDLVMEAGAGNGNGQGGTFTMNAGEGGNSGSGGSFNLNGGDGNGDTSNGGSVNLNAGIGGDGTGQGGHVDIFAGYGGTGGDVSIYAGESTRENANGGNIKLTTGAPNGSGVVGKVYIIDGITGRAAKLDPSQITATDKTFTFPNASTTLVGDNNAQTITNKDINADDNAITNIGSAEVSTDLITGFTALTTPVAADDYILVYDASATALKKMLLEDLPGGVGGSITVSEIDGSPSVSGVSSIRFNNASLTDDGGGQVSVRFPYDIDGGTFYDTYISTNDIDGGSF